MNRTIFLNTISILFILNSCSEKKEILAAKNTDIFNDSVVHEIRIIANTKNLLDSLKFDKKNKKNNDITTFRSCNVKIDGTLLKNTGIKYKGESSYNFQKNDKKSFEINLSKFDKKQKYQSIKRFALNNQFKDPSFMREKLMLDLIRSEGLPASKCSYAKVYFNKEYLGLYLLVEDIDKQFLKRNFDSNKGNLYNGKPNALLTLMNDSTNRIEKNYRRKTNKKSEKYEDLEHLINTINSNQNGEKYKEELDEVFDTESCLKLWAINNLFMNVDCYNMLYPHNYMLFFHKQKGNKTKKAHWIGYDYNYSFGAWSPKLTLNQMINFDILHINSPTKNYPLAQKLLGNESSYKKFYINYLKSLISRKIKSNWLDKQITKNYILIREFVYEDFNKMNSNSDFELNIEESLGNIHDPGAFSPGLRLFITERIINVEKQIIKINKSI